GGSCVPRPPRREGGRAPAGPPAEARARAARNLLPVALIVPDGRVPPAHTFHARVWVDAGFRQRPHWRSYVEEIVRRTNLYLGAAVGGGIEIAGQPWGRAGRGSRAGGLPGLGSAGPGHRGRR